MIDQNAQYQKQIAYLFENSPFYRDLLTAAGFPNAASVGTLDQIATLPFTEKDDLRKTRTSENTIGTHLATSLENVTRIYSTSGTTGTPSYIPLTQNDLDSWITISCRSYGASGVTAGERMVSTYNAGPFVAGVTLDAFAKLGLCHIPVGAGNTERLVAAIQNLHPTVIGMTPSYALYVAEWAAARDIDLKTSSIKRIMVAGEPGGGEPAMRAAIEVAWNAKVTEAMGIGDIGVSLWGECEQQNGMHFNATDFVHFELINPDTGEVIPLTDGAEGELVYTHLNHQAAPVLRFRSRDHIRIEVTPCACGRTTPRIRCIGRTDDMLIVRGVNVFPTAIREVVNEFAPDVTGVILITPTATGPKQNPPLPVTVEMAEGTNPTAEFATAIQSRIRAKLIATTKIKLVPAGTLPRTDYKSKLVDWSQAKPKGTAK
ncbi:MAG: phenylacetate--CoA ligase family protein [Paracoccaceae bacterium]